MDLAVLTTLLGAASALVSAALNRFKTPLIDFLSITFAFSPFLYAFALGGDLPELLLGIFGHIGLYGAPLATLICLIARILGKQPILVIFPAGVAFCLSVIVMVMMLNGISRAE